MSEPTPFELQQADVAREAMGKGFMLVTHLHFSLLKEGEVVLGEVDSPDGVSEYLASH
jgi:hypothetical protein